MEKKWVVYQHTNKINNKIYIGITCQNVDRRWRKNGIGYKGHCFFYRAIQKYGWDNFEHIVLFDNLSEEQAKSKEKELIKQLNLTNPNFGYNETEGGDGHCGRKHTPEEIEKLRILNLGEKNKMFGRKHTEEAKNKMRQYRLGKKMPKELLEKIIAKNSRAVVQLDLEGNFIKEWKSASEIQRQLGFFGTSIIAVCRGKRQKTAYGYKWRYKDER